jgi:hypothetical protein
MLNISIACVCGVRRYQLVSNCVSLYVVALLLYRSTPHKLNNHSSIAVLIICSRTAVLRVLRSKQQTDDYMYTMQWLTTSSATSSTSEAGTLVAKYIAPVW